MSAISESSGRFWRFLGSKKLKNSSFLLLQKQGCGATLPPTDERKFGRIWQGLHPFLASSGVQPFLPWILIPLLLRTFLFLCRHPLIYVPKESKRSCRPLFLSFCKRTMFVFRQVVQVVSSWHYQSFFLLFCKRTMLYLCCLFFSNRMSNTIEIFISKSAVKNWLTPELAWKGCYRP